MSAYTRRISLQGADSGLGSALEFAVYSADGTTVLVSRRNTGVTEILSSGSYEAAVVWDTAWGGVIRWTTDAGAVLVGAETFQASEVVITPAVAAQVAAAVSGSALLIHRGDSWSAAMSDLGDITGREKLWFTAKRRATDADVSSLIQMTEGGGLLVLAGGAPIGTGSVTVDDEVDGQVTIRLSPAATAELPEVSGGVYDLQCKLADGSIRTLTQAAFSVKSDVTRSIS